MSKSRFYDKALVFIENKCGKEIALDISGYVSNLEFERSLLVSELLRANTVGGRMLLSQIGYPAAEHEELEDRLKKLEALVDAQKA